MRQFTFSVYLLCCACGAEFSAAATGGAGASSDSGGSDAQAATGATGGAGGEMVGSASGGAGGAGAAGGATGSGGVLSGWGTPELIVELSTGLNEDDPTLTADELEIYFNLSGDIYRATRDDKNSPWSVPTYLSQLSTSSTETTPGVSGDGLTIYVSSDFNGTMDIWVSQRSSRQEPWPIPSLDAQLSSTGADFAPFPVDDGVLLFDSNRAGTLGGLDIFMSTRQSAFDLWGPPVPTPEFNTGENELDPWMNIERTLLYFASNRDGSSTPGSFADIYYQQRATPNDPWGPAINVAELNTPAMDQDVWLSPDAKTMYFSSDRHGTEDLFVVRRQ